MADGTSMANMLAMAALIAPGDEVLVEHPAYEPMVAAARFLGAEITRFAPARDPASGSIPTRSRAALTPRTRLILLTNLHNPSALSPTSRDAARGSARSAPRVLIDEVYLDAAPGAAERGAARRRLRHHLQPDQGLRPSRPALRLDPRRARAGRADVAAERAVRRRPGPCRRAAVLHRARPARRDRRRDAAPCSPATARSPTPSSPAATSSRRRRWLHGITAFPRLLARRRRRARTRCCARATTPRSCPAASSGSPTISGSASAARPRWSRPGSSGSARRWTSCA